MAGVKGMRDKLLKSPERVEQWRASVRVALIRNRLTKHILGEIEMSATQVRACEILLTRAIPTVGQVEISGKDGGPIETASVSETDLARWLAFEATKKAIEKARA